MKKIANWSLKDCHRKKLKTKGGCGGRTKVDCGGCFAGGGVVAVHHHILWIAACRSLMGCGRLKRCPIVSSCLLLVLLSRSLIFFSVIKISV